MTQSGIAIEVFRRRRSIRALKEGVGGTKGTRNSSRWSRWFVSRITTREAIVPRCMCARSATERSFHCCLIWELMKSIVGILSGNVLVEPHFQGRISSWDMFLCSLVTHQLWWMILLLLLLLIIIRQQKLRAN